MATRQQLKYLDIELLGEGGAGDAHDVSFGGGSRRPPMSQRSNQDSDDERRPDRRSIGVTLGSIALIAVAVIATRGTTSPAVTAGQAVTLPLVTIAVGGSTDTRGPGEFPPPDTTILGSISGGVPIMATDQPWQIYVESGGDVYRVDVQTGEISLFEDLTSEGIFAVLQTDAGPIVANSAASGGSGYITALGPSGTYWTQTDTAAELIDAATGQTIRTLSVPWPDFSYGTYVFVSTPAGDPMVYGPDQRVWVVSPDDVLTPLPAGSLAVSDRGGQVWSRCDDAGVCRSVAESAVGAQTLPSLNQGWFSFSPDGVWLLSAEVGEQFDPVSWAVLDMRSGESIAVELPAMSSPISYYGSSPTAGAWSPDGRFFVAGDEQQLYILDTATLAVSTVEAPTLPGPLRPLAVF